MRQTRRTLLLLALAAACHHTPSAATASSPGALSAPASVQVTEANIIAIVLAANNTDLSYARLVPARTRSAAVKTFAQRMMTDHTALSNQITEIATRRGINAEDNAISLDFRDHSAQRRDILRELEGAKFDSTYAANEIQYHTELLGAIDQVLLPSARTPELREWVVRLKPAVSAHLAHAEQMRASVASGK